MSSNFRIPQGIAKKRKPAVRRNRSRRMASASAAPLSSMPLVLMANESATPRGHTTIHYRRGDTVLVDGDQILAVGKFDLDEEDLDVEDESDDEDAEEIQRKFVAEINVAELQSKAAGGDLYSMHTLAMMMLEGARPEEVRGSESDALKLFLRAAKGGYAESQSALGVCFRTGAGGAPVCLTTATEFFRQRPGR